MPEGPEVANLADELNFYLSGRILENIDIVSGKMIRHGIPEGVEHLCQNLPMLIEEVEYRGKLIIIHLKKDDRKFWIFSTLGMTGGWYLKKRKHAHVHFMLKHVENHSIYPDKVYFVDSRCFGTFEATDNTKEYQRRLERIQPGFLGKYQLTEEQWMKNISKHSGKNICRTLMDQGQIIGGIGNYLLSEILHRAGISPWITWKEVSENDRKNIYRVAKKTILQSYLCRGATIENYESITGEKGESTFYFQVYGRSKDEQKHKVVSQKGPHGRTIWISTKYSWYKN